MSVANYLTLARIFLSPLFLLVYVKYQEFGIHLTTVPYILLSILTLPELSDACDGYFARRYNEVTDLGKILDPMADSIYRISLFLTFTLPPVQLPMFLIFVFIYRDSMISTLRTVCALKGFALAARTSGKVKAIIQACAALFIILLLIPYSLNLISHETLHTSSLAIASFAAIYTMGSGIEYFYANRGYIKSLLMTKKDLLS